MSSYGAFYIKCLSAHASCYGRKELHCEIIPLLSHKTRSGVHPHLHYDVRMCISIGSLRWDDGWARERQAEVKHKNAGLPSVFIHPSSLGGNCETTLVSSHRKRRCYSFIFLFGNSVLSIFRAVYFTNTFFILRSTFLGFLLSEKSNQNVNSVNRLSNSSLCVVVLFPPKTSAPCARVRNDRNWREKLSSRSSLPAAMSAVVEQALVLS